MRYVNLKPERFLAFYSRLDPIKKAAAEDAANAWVDLEFAAWDRTTWSFQNGPPDVIRAAEAWAAAEYVFLDFQANRPDANPRVMNGLREAAKSAVDSIKRAGFITSTDGQPLYPMGHGQSMFVPVMR